MSTCSFRRARAGFAILVFAAFFFRGRASRADMQFPPAVQSTFKLECTPQCTLCHKDLSGGFGTIVSPFGKSMLNAGLFILVDGLQPAYDKLEADETDSDGDGEPDITELKEGRDPNDPDPDAYICTSPEAIAAAKYSPRYGCGAHMARGAASELAGGASAFLVAAVLSLCARRGARRRGRVQRMTRK